MSRKRRTDVEPAEWFFFSGGPGAPRYGDDPTKHAVDHDTATFVREVLQNANDQGLPNDDPVEVTFRFVTLSGARRSEFLEALGWDRGLGDRLGAVADTDRGRGYDDLFDRLDDPDADIRLLIVEDRNTTGLTGDWDEDSNYAALVRDELYSNKQDDSAGGSYGLGKSVLWTFSGASTVVFNSHVSTDGRRTPDTQRLIGRTKLPTHRLESDDIAYQGAGWFCLPTETDGGVRPSSVWGDSAAALADRLHLDRPDVTGTSALVVDYRDPTRDDCPPLEEVAEEFVDAAVTSFWPAIYRGNLEVTVEVDDETWEVNVRDVPEIRPFVDCYESRYDGDETLDAPGDVAGLDVPVELPARSDGTETPAATVRLAARLSSPADDDSYLNHVALFRGSGMVVKYYDQSRVAYGDKNFHGLLACGEARHPHEDSPGDREVERFLRYAEPPEHDDWQSTENLREQYQRGFRTALDEMFDTLRDGLRHLVSQTDGSGGSLTNRVRKRFPIHGGQARPSGASPEVVFDIESVSGFADERWTFTGRIEPLEEEFAGWTAEVTLAGVGEDGTQYDDITIASLDAAHPDVTARCEDGIGRLTAGPEADHVEFEGESERIGDGDVRSGQVGETQLEIRAELETEGEHSS